VTFDEFKLLVVNLPQATTIDLYRLAYISRPLYNEPQRALAIRKELHLGKTVQYFDSSQGAFHTGKIVALRDRDFSLEDRERNVRFKSLPYAAIDLVATQALDQPQTQERPSFAKHPMPNSPRPVPREKVLTKSDFQVGGKVSFINREGAMLIGGITRLNQQTATVVVDNIGGHWRISYSLLRHVLDI
jgi:hypothetical protein